MLSVEKCAKDRSHHVRGEVLKLNNVATIFHAE